MTRDRYLRKAQVIVLALCIFMAGLMLGRWTTKHEWAFLLAILIYAGTICVLSLSIHRQVKRDEAELRQMMQDLEQAQAARERERSGQ
jgi:hypothetical protein